MSSTYKSPKEHDKNSSRTAGLSHYLGQSARLSPEPVFLGPIQWRRHVTFPAKIIIIFSTSFSLSIVSMEDLYCLWAYGSGSQRRPNWMHIGSGETQEGSGFWAGGYIGRVRNRGS